MSRGVRKSVDERVTIIDQEIAETTDRRDTYNAKIKELESKKQGLLNEKKQEKLLEVAQLLENSGLSPEEAIAKLTKDSSNSESA